MFDLLFTFCHSSLLSRYNS